ncbi:hypothetical protein [Desulfosporosinus acidiphilus]|uniref:hypothetical protein n=1 Tax=Desulfosporosinus acidiphilus TaxID=885581 RepID=UPI0002D72500|nr:hypothetical protein [Desulfosporosinus acidiphilus]
MSFRNTPRDPERGATVYLLCFALAVVIALGFHFDTPQGYLTKSDLHNTIEVSLQAAASISVSQNGYAPIDPTTALSNFNLYMQKNLQLDSNNNPLPSSPLASQLKILQFNVLNTVPTTDPITGDTVSTYSLEAVVTTTVKQAMGGLYEGSPYTITDFARVSEKEPS